MGTTAKLTDRKIKAFKPRNSVYDVIEGDGFGVRVMPSGVVSFQYVYKVAGKRKRFMLGRYPHTTLATARERYLEAHAGRITHRIDPVVERAKEKDSRAAQEQLAAQTITMAELAERYLDGPVTKFRESTRREEARLLTEVVAELGEVPAHEIERRHVVALLDRIAARAPIVANRTLSVLQRMFSWGAGRGTVEHSPVVGIPRPGGKEKSRTRELNTTEIGILWRALDDTQADPRLVAGIRFLLASGQRKSEVLGAIFNEFEDGWWELSAERTKKDRPHRVPVSKTMAELIGEGSGLVFPSPVTGRAFEARAPNHLIAKMRARGQLDRIPSFTVHDLRRTVATKLGSLGVERFIQDRLLNHIDGSQGGIYDRFEYADQKRRALEKWDRRLRAIVSGEVAQVVSF